MTMQKAQAQLKKASSHPQSQAQQTPQQIVQPVPKTILASPRGNPIQPINEGESDFAGWNSSFTFNAPANGDVPALSISVPVKFAKIKSKGILPSIRMEDVNGNEVEYRPDTEYHFGYFLKSTGQPLTESEVRFFQVYDDGSKVSVDKFQKTKDIKIEKLLPRSQLEGYLPEKDYEMWSDNVPALAQGAEYLEATDQIAVAKIVLKKSFKAYYALIYPVMEPGGKFSLAMTLTTGKKVYDKEMDFKPAMQTPQPLASGPQGVLGEI